MRLTRQCHPTGLHHPRTLGAADEAPFLSGGRLLSLPGFGALRLSQPQILSCMRLDTVRSLVYTLPGALPRIRLQMESRASLILAKDPRIWILSSHSEIRVRVAFSIASH